MLKLFELEMNKIMRCRIQIELKYERKQSYKKISYLLLLETIFRQIFMIILTNLGGNIRPESFGKLSKLSQFSLLITCESRVVVRKENTQQIFVDSW